MTLTEKVRIRDELYFRNKICKEKNVIRFIPFATQGYSKPKHLSSLTDELKEITFNNKKVNLCLAAPPQHFKTTTLQHWVALHLKIHPKANIVYMSYNETLATERVYEITKILKKIGIKPDPKQSTKKQFWTEDGGKITAAGIDVGFTGRKADVIIIDDPHRSLDDVTSNARMKQLINTFEGVVETREQNHTSVILTHTRWHKRDLIGWVLENREHYKYLNIPVLIDGEPIAPDLLSLEEIEKKRKTNKSRFNAMYLGQPLESLSSLFQKEIHYRETPTEYEGLSIGCDLAYTDSSRSDYTAYVVMYKVGDKYHIEEAGRWQSDINVTKIRLMELYEKYQVPIQLEDNGVQKGVNSLLSNYGIYINRNKIVNSKYTRALDFASQFNLGNVSMKRGAWNQDYIKELLEFTGSGREHDDWVDASVMAFKGLQSSFAVA